MRPALPAVYPVRERTETTGVFRDYTNDAGQIATIPADGPEGIRPAAETATEAAQVFARADLRKAS